MVYDRFHLNKNERFHLKRDNLLQPETDIYDFIDLKLFSTKEISMSTEELRPRCRGRDRCAGISERG